jgi:DNA-directed RNA polymerases I, II, and III subunit RPABC4
MYVCTVLTVRTYLVPRQVGDISHRPKFCRHKNATNSILPPPTPFTYTFLSRTTRLHDVEHAASPSKLYEFRRTLETATAMSREQYQVPTAGGQNTAAGSSLRYDEHRAEPTMNYICGDCGLRFPMKKGDPIRCKECGCRVLYKERTKR